MKILHLTLSVLLHDIRCIPTSRQVYLTLTGKVCNLNGKCIPPSQPFNLTIEKTLILGKNHSITPEKFKTL